MEQRIFEITSAAECMEAKKRMAELTEMMRGNPDSKETRACKEEIDQLSELLSEYEDQIGGFFAEED